MECTGARERLSCYLDGELDEFTLELIEAHLAVCSDCRRELVLLKAVVDASMAIERLDAPSDLKTRIRGATTCAPQPVGSLIAKLWRAAGLRWAGGAVTAAVGAAVLVAIMLSAPQAPKPAEPINSAQPSPRAAAQPAPSAAPASVSPTVETAPPIEREERTRIAFKPSTIAKAVKPHARATKPGKHVPAAAIKPDGEPDNVAETPVSETPTPDPNGVAETPNPAPAEHKPARPTELASAPAVASDDPESFIQQMKASAAMRKRGGSGGIQLFSTKF